MKSVRRSIMTALAGILLLPACGTESGLLPSADAVQVLDPYLRMMVSGDGGAAAKTAKALGVTADRLLSIFIKTNDVAALRDFLERHGGAIHTEIGAIVTATIPAAVLADLAQQSGVLYVEQAKPLQTRLNLSRPLTGADTVQAGQALPSPYTGAGVIIGIVDSGIDWGHPAFESRILALWDTRHESTAAWPSPIELATPYGIECLPHHFVTKVCPARDETGHGTHVAGIAASSHATFTGMAPDADLIVVDIGEFRLPDDADVTPTVAGFQQGSAEIVDGVQYIFQKAEALGRPAVVNLSLGDHFGAHDGSSLFEQALNGLVDGYEGRAIVVAAGNENNQADGVVASVHAGYTLANEAFATEFVARQSQYHAILLDMWVAVGSELSFAIGVDDYQQYQVSPIVAPGATATFRSADQQLDIVLDAAETVNPLNGKQHVVIAITAVEGNEGIAPTASKYTFDLIVSGTGTFDAWLPAGGVFTRRAGDFSHTGYAYQPGDSQHTIAAPATATSVLAVASFASRDRLEGLIGTERFSSDYQWTPPGEISPFSSRGPSLAPSVTGQKPEIAAPGEWIAAPLSGDARLDFLEAAIPMDSGGQHVLASGTSMAAPHVAGAVALLFQRNPHLTAAQIKRLVCLNATVDAAVGSIPNNAWGFGKLNVAATMQQFDTTPLEEPLPYSATKLAETAAAVAPALSSNAATSSGGCTMTPRSANTRSGWPLSCYAILLLLIGYRYRRHRTRTPSCVGRALCLGVVALCVAGCGGADETDVADLLQIDLSVPNALNLQKHGVVVSAEDRAAVFVAIDKEHARKILLGVPLDHFRPDDAIPLGGDNLLNNNPDEALLLVMAFSDSTMTTPVTAHVSLGGTVQLTDVACWSHDCTVSGVVTDALLYPVDVGSLLVQRGTTGIALAGTFDSSVKDAEDQYRVIFSAQPSGGPRGTQVTVTGVHLTDMTVASICGHTMPLTHLSSTRAVFTVDTLPCSEGTIDLLLNDEPGATTLYSQRSYHLEFPDTAVVPAAHAVRRAAYNAARNLLVLYSDTAEVIDVYSVADRTFVTPLMVPYAISAFDIDPQGDAVVACIADASQLLILPLDAGSGDAVQTIALPVGHTCRDIAFGQAHRALVYTEPPAPKGTVIPEGNVLVFDLADHSVAMPTELNPVKQTQEFFKSGSGATIVLQLQPGISSGGVNTIVYQSHADGIFTKRATSKKADTRVRGISWDGSQLWGTQNVYDLDLQLVESFQDPALFWDVSHRYSRRIALTPDGTVAILSDGSYLVDIVDPQTRTPIETGIRVVGKASDALFSTVTADGSTLILVEAANLYLVRVEGLLGK